MENDDIVSEDQAVATILNDYFSNITKSLNIADNNENLATGDEIPDPITAAIEKYRSHPSVMLIKSHYEDVKAFDFRRASITEVLEQVNNLDTKKASPIGSIPARSRGKFCNNRNFSLFTFCTIANQRAPIRSRDKLLRASRVVAVEKTIGKLPSQRLVAVKIYFRRSFRNFKSVLSNKFPNQGCLPTCLLYLVFAK